MKKIIIGMLVLLVCVSMVSGYLGNELVTCGGLYGECGTDYELYWDDIEESWFNEYDATNNYFYVYTLVDVFVPLNQSFLSVEIGRNYNVSINHTSCNTDGLIVELGGVNTSITDTTSFANPIVNSFNINPINTKGVVIYAYTTRDCTIQRVLSISVKEIIEPKVFRLELKATNPNGNVFRQEIKADKPQGLISKTIRWLLKVFR